MDYKILIPQDISEAGKEYLTQHGYEIIVGENWNEYEYRQAAKDCDALLLRTFRADEELLNNCPKLKIVAKHGVGTDNVDLEECEKLGIWVVNAPVSNSISVAEHAVSLICACAKNIAVSDKEVRNGNWNFRENNYGTELEGKTLGVLGLGNIGKKVAKIAGNGFSMNIIGHDIFADRSTIPEYIEIVNNLFEFVERSDFISIHVPLNANTSKMINNEFIKHMKKTSYLINTSRGGIINETDLVTALVNKLIAGAGLDVMDKEPPQNDNCFYNLNNVVLTPHSAALTHESMDKMGLHAAMGIDALLSGKKPEWTVIQGKYKNIK